MNQPMLRSDYAFHLPGELIAQHPLDRRDDSRLLCLDRRDGALSHRRFRDLPGLLRPGDVLVMNDSRVMPSRLLGRREGTGGAAELLLLEQKGKDLWETLARPGKKLRPGARVVFGEGLLTGEIVDTLEGGNRLVRFFYEGDSFFAVLDRIGQMPLPPYITEALEDRERYQTVYSRELGSAAAPTAGLHFTPELLEALRNKGIQTGFVTLHVGLGTFRPVKAENITDHHMHLGTTSCRTLESAWKEGALTPGPGSTGIFIYPGYRFQVLDGLITNFHLPESTLIMLVSAFAGYESTMNAYREAVQERYRFFSFGDSMFIGEHGAKEGNV